MNLRLLMATLFAAFVTTIHILAGSTQVATPLLQSTLPTELRLTLFAAWQLTNIVMGSSVVAFFIGSLPAQQQASRYMVIFASLLWLGFAAAFIVTALIQPEGGWLFKLQQWTMLTPVGLLGLWGASSMRRN